MTLVLNGTTGVSAVDGSAGTPAIQGNDTNTGVFFPAADTVAIATGGTERVRVDTSGNVGIGVTPTYKLQVVGDAAISDALRIQRSTSSLYLTVARFWDGAGNPLTGGAKGDILAIGNGGGNPLVFATGDTERARIDSSGNLLVGTTSLTAGNGRITAKADGGGNAAISANSPGTTAYNVISIENGNGQVGRIQTNGSATSYLTSSDYRLKENIQPMQGALARVQQLKPVTYKWKVDGSEGQGFIAHELREVCPDSVGGEKDAVNEDGSINPQGIDTSFLVATLTAAIQELNAKVQALEAQLAGAAA